MKEEEFESEVRGVSQKAKKEHIQEKKRYIDEDAVKDRKKKTAYGSFEYVCMGPAYQLAAVYTRDLQNNERR